MKELKKLYPAGWILYCPECFEYTDQSEPKNTTRGKSVVIDDEPCAACVKKNEGEVQEAQLIMGRLGLPKEKECTNNLQLLSGEKPTSV